MEDHEPSDLIPLFNGMIISFINYELQVRIEPKTSEEYAHAKFENYGPLDSVPTSHRKEAPSSKQTPASKKPSEVQHPQFDNTAVAHAKPAVVVDDHNKIAQTDKISLAELQKHDQNSPLHSADGE
jgi:hypothetical protein